MSRKVLIILVTLVALGAAGVFVVAAQDEVPPFGPGWMHHRGGEDFGSGMLWGGRGMHGGFGLGLLGGNGEPMMVSVAEALALEPEALFDALRAGQTLAEIAEAQGVELDTVYDALVAEAGTHLAEQVDVGTITQEQADAHLAWIREHVTDMPMFTGSGFGPCMSGMDSFSSGMMGRGRWNNS